jgi:hypothetical protein
MWIEMLAVSFFALIVMFLDQQCSVGTAKNGSAMPLGTTSVYCDDFVSTTEVVYNLMLGSNCNDSISKAGL